MSAAARRSDRIAAHVHGLEAGEEDHSLRRFGEPLEQRLRPRADAQCLTATAITSKWPPRRSGPEPRKARAGKRSSLK